MMQGYLFSGLLGFVATALLIEIFAPVAGRIGLVDHPGGRKQHTRSTPLIGGLAMFVGFAFAALTLGISLGTFRPLFAGALILVVVGVLDDLHDLSPNAKLIAQITASALMALWGGVLLADLGHLEPDGGRLLLGLLGVPLTLFAAVGIINATNMIDGLDGLAASLALVTVGALILVAWSGGAWAPLGMLIVLCGSILGFLIYNLRLRGPALVFMGDAGSMLLGFVVVWFLIDFSQGPDRLIAPATALWLVAVPLLDTLCVIARRLGQGRSPLSADRAHCHHVLQDAGLSRRQTLTVMVLFALGTAAIGLLGEWLRIAEPIMLTGFLVLLALYFWSMGRTQDVKAPNWMPMARLGDEEAGD